MSHFPVYVFQREVGYNDLLEPYDENIKLEPYVEYTREEAIKNVRDDIEEYKNGHIYQEYLKDPDKYRKNHSENPNHINYLEHFHERFKWTDEQCYQEKKRWYEDDMIDEDGNLYSTYNPKSKWDWYVKVFEAKVKEIDWDKTPIPFAFIDPDGNWYERGKMGWWGIATNEKNKDEWEECYRKFLSSLIGDEIITFVDCHI